MNIYFAGSIRGGREDVKIYQEIVAFLKTKGTVLTEHITLESIHDMGEDDKTEEFIYKRDIDWLEQSDIVVAEVTQPSLGVGYELAYAESKKIPVICLFRENSGNHLSAMIKGDSYFKVIKYTDIKEVITVLPSYMVIPQEVV
ncbi:MAG: Deoxyribonucleoside 5'-monophosphate N-glycosidase [candidate division WS6 bacterium GW2011_GWC1_36_11]|uniref:Putative 2'-deoxynucleoside 5'-phosphate N-hydrolase 1 n=2 Tax=Candidatus Dojkabacteria TaxID=74243 RepID=A0A0G0DU42_9BACT|nr:MAG: Deoxyribonucleoside 5'-monophosphate N-glycosidase [candidate division WS6 bacterium GW2011_GWC1_36_11]KKQ16816.1 MAG: Deoxyribonucleoside 5'-monophosphate N-glycosidase [candidate division WS6 bacterium GW2011_GWF1_36_8]